MKTVVEGGIADTVVEVMVVEEAVDRYLPVDCISGGLACKHSRFAVGEAEEWNGDVGAGSNSSSFCG